MDNIETSEEVRVLTQERAVGKQVLDIGVKRSNRLSGEVLFMKHKGKGKARMAAGSRPEPLEGWR